MANQVVYGFHTLTSVFNERVTTVGVDRVQDAVNVAFENHNENLNRMQGVFVRNVESYKTTFAGEFITRNQPLDEHGRPYVVQGGTEYEVAFPLLESGNAMGWTWVAFQYLTVEEVNRKVRSLLIGDMRWMFDHILAALFASTSWTWWSKATGELTVQSLANGDTATYMVTNGSDQAATDDHIQAQANAIGSGADNPYPAIFADLSEHPENGAAPMVISFLPTALATATRALATFNPVADPNITMGTASDRLTGTLGVAHPGTLIGYEDSGVWIVEYPRLPAGYIVSVAYGGESPVGMRQHVAENLRGFVEVEPVQGSAAERMPYLRRDWYRGAGFGIWNRVGARIDRIGNGTYAVPTNFESPMP